MRRVRLLVILTVLSVGFCNAQNKNNGKMNYKVEIFNYYFGRTNHRTTITNESIVSKKYMLVAPVETKHQLSEKEKNKIIKFLKKFPLSELKEKYVNNDVEDGTQIKFVISINDVERSIFVANAFQENLGDLVALIVPMLKEDYIGYNKKSVPWEAKK
jgi:hypothetical protein